MTAQHLIKHRALLRARPSVTAQVTWSTQNGPNKYTALFQCSYDFLCSVARSCPNLCDPMDCNMPGFPICHNLPEFAQTHVQSVSDAIQPCHPLLPSSPPAFNLAQHQGLFQRVGSLHQVAKALELQHQSFQWKFRVTFLYDWLVWSPCCPRDSQESSLAPEFESINSLALSLLYSPILTSICDHWKKT